MHLPTCMYSFVCMVFFFLFICSLMRLIANLCNLCCSACVRSVFLSLPLNIHVYKRRHSTSSNPLEAGEEGGWSGEKLTKQHTKIATTAPECATTHCKLSN